MAFHQLARPLDIAELFGQGISSGIGKIVDARTTQKGLEALGFSPDQARKASFFHPSIIKDIVQEKVRGDNRRISSAPGLQALIPELSAEDAAKIGTLTPAIQAEFYKNYLANPVLEGQQSSNNSQQSGIDAFKNIPSSQYQKSNEDELRSIIQQHLGFNKNPSNNSFGVEQIAPEIRQQISQQSPMEQQDIPKPFATKVYEARARKEDEKAQALQRKEDTKEKALRFKETKADRKEILDKAKTARQSYQDLERLEELEKEGKLDTPGYVEFLKRSGLDIPALMSPGSEEFNKIAANFIRGAKEIFGSRISNFEVEQFLKTIPNLSQSPEGRKRVIANLKNIARGNLEYSDAYKEVMKENQGVPPFDLLEKVDDKVSKKLGVLSKKFRQDLSKPVPKGQNKFITALQSAAGSFLGIPGSISKGLSGAANAATLAKLIL